MTAVEILERIQAATPDDKILLLSLLNYDQLPVTADLLDKDVPAWRNVKDIANAVSSLELDVVPAGTAIPYFIEADLYPQFDQLADIITKTKSGNNYIRWTDMQITEVFSGTTFTGWNVELHTNDNAVSSEDIYIILKA